MGLEVLNEIRTLEKKGVLAPRLMLGTIWEQVSSSFIQQIGICLSKLPNQADNLFHLPNLIQVQNNHLLLIIHTTIKKPYLFH